MQPEQLGPYRIVRKLGHGGMGTVFEGINVDTDEPAAIKVLATRLADEDDFRQRFEAEIETLRKLRHPNIVRLFGFGEQEEILFYAMELVDGKSLDQELRSGRYFDWRHVAEIGIATCQALRHAHDRGVIHRDIKPANLLMAVDGTVKLSDFGIARLFGYTRLTTVGNVLGTVEYMAPEQADDRPIDHRVDLYSLGGVLYALLARRPPFRAKSLAEMVGKHRSAKPVPVRQYYSDVPAELASIIRQLLEKNPEDRIANAAVLARRLKAMLLALSLPADTIPAESPPKSGESQAEEAEEEAANDSDLAPSVAAPDRPGVDDLPPTRTLEKGEDLPPMGGSLEPAEESLPETRATSAFENFKGDGYELKEPPAPKRPPKPTGRFFPVKEEELDRFETQEPTSKALIAPQRWALAISLVAVGLATWYLLQPPSADALYDKIRAVTADRTIESYREAEDDVREFLVRYSDDPRCEDVRKYQMDIELDHLEGRFERRAGKKEGAEGLLPIQRAYLEAINYMRLDPDRGRAKLQALIDLYDNRSDASESFDTSSPTGQCLELARRRLRRMEEQLKESSADHLDLIQARLDRADELSGTDPDKARTMRQAVIELYQDKPWAEEAVRRVKAALAAEAASGKRQNTTEDAP